MNKSIFYALLLVLSVSCKQDKKSIEYIDSPMNTPLPIETELQIEEKVAPELPVVPLAYLEDYSGKYAGQENVFVNGELSKRLQKLERFNYEALIQNYNTETKIVIIDNVLHMSGCKQHDCPSNAYDFYIDLDNDNINVFYFRNNMLRVYQEKGLIELPSELAKELETKNNNAGIGNPDGIESNYEL
jgi:hypothetical protein